MRMLRTLCALLALLCAPSAQTMAQEKANVDLRLVLALDASRSMDEHRWKLQIDGYVAAFLSEEVQHAIRSGRDRAIAVTVVVWSGGSEQKQVTEWHVVRDKQSAEAFAAAIQKIERPFIGTLTNIAAAIDFSMKLLLSSGFTASYGQARSVIDVSGDGDQNEAFGGEAYSVDDLHSGNPLGPVRNLAVSHSITINGLAIKAEPGSMIGIYYRSEVIAGHDAFVVEVERPDDRETFARAIRRKLILEIALRKLKLRHG